MKKLIAIILVFVAGCSVFSDDEVVEQPGIVVENAPRQAKIPAPRSFIFNGYEVTPLVGFQLKARVLSKKNYRFGREAELSPVDLALGWQKMSDVQVLAAIDISQSNRWYRWWTDNYPIPRLEIETQSANMHLIPADDQVAERIDGVEEGDLIELSGSLVRVDAGDGWHWVSSLSRADTGGHSCELIFVESFRIL